MANAKYGTAQRFIEDAANATDPVSCIIWPYSVGTKGYGRLTYKKRTWFAHRLSLTIFSGGEKLDLLAVHGPCHNRLCVNPHHLRWGTAKTNADNMIRDNTRVVGELTSSAKLSAHQATEILLSNEPGFILAKRFNVSKSTVYDIKKYRTWRHLTVKQMTHD